MATRSNWISIMLVCTLPAGGVGVRTTHSSFVASFFYACAGSEPAPTRADGVHGREPAQTAARVVPV